MKSSSIGGYVPPLSAHSPHCSRSMVTAELHRLIVTNTFERDFARQCITFMQKVRRRGISTLMLADIASTLVHDKRSWILAARRQKRSSQIAGQLDVGVTIKYCRGLELLSWQRVSAVLRGIGVRFRPRISVHKNLFRILYKSTWQGGL